ncbi:C1 family peptidase [Methylibium rhizosphaerae]|uniref:C1 family peptidase n=1 Tax=Methylibium rhizosphaerae TaxID=2570323 RepID=UPI0015E3BBA6|nr:C1 family peptidase [Methylibium rhizosphaerae]
MEAKRRAGLQGWLGIAGAVCWLAACGGGSSAPEDAAPQAVLFTAANLFGADAPAGATWIDEPEFAQRVAAGELTIRSAARDANNRQEQLADFQREALQLRERNSVDPIDADLGALGDAGAAPLQAPQMTLTLADGTQRSVLLQPPAARLHQRLQTQLALEDPQRLRALYAELYGGLGDTLRESLPTPRTLENASLETLRAALADVDAVLATVSDLDGMRPVQEAPAGTSKPRTARLQSVTIREGGAGSGSGSDMSGTCGSYRTFGIMARLDWPLKDFQTSVRDQGQRVTCWAFAAVAALESRDLVTRGSAPNLSEQFVVNFDHGGPPAWYGVEGGFADVVLNRLAERGQPVAFESAWTYNRSLLRDSLTTQTGVCRGYDGFCGENSAQDPLICVRRGADVVCGTETVRYAGTSPVTANRTAPLWGGGALLVNILRQRLEQGIPLIASFEVSRGFEVATEPGRDQGWVTDLSDAGIRGGHVTALIGFASDDVVRGFAPVLSGGTGGGWFVLKNSWGCGSGDGGYIYVPVRWAQRFFHSIHELQIPAERSTAWRERVARDFRPRLSLVVEGGNRVVRGVPFTVRAVMEGGGSDCCTLAWSPAAGTSPAASFVLNEAGRSAVISLTARNRRVDAQAAASVVVEVVERTDAPPTGTIALSPDRGAAPYLRASAGSDRLALHADVVDPEGTPISARWRATGLTDAGMALGTPLELGSGIDIDWNIATAPLGSFLSEALCQRGRGQRVRIELVASDAAGNFSTPYTAQREIALACAPN